MQGASCRANGWSGFTMQGAGCRADGWSGFIRVRKGGLVRGLGS